MPGNRGRNGGRGHTLLARVDPVERLQWCLPLGTSELLVSECLCELLVSDAFVPSPNDTRVAIHTHIRAFVTGLRYIVLVPSSKARVFPFVRGGRLLKF